MNPLPGAESATLELPPPDATAIACSKRLAEIIVEQIELCGGVIGFDEYMRMALYQPGFGYYSGDSIKFGASGDFVTAPEISPLYGACLARQAEVLIEQGCAARILEIGAGSGSLCGQIMESLPALRHYQILDLSAALKQRQQRYLRARLSAERFSRIEWLTSLPEAFDGIVIANELLDAMPVHILQKQDDWRELGVGYDGGRFAWQTFEPAREALQAIRAIEARLGELPPDYRCELNLNLRPWFKALAQSCRHAVAIIIDYGFEQNEYYHPARAHGTLGCYYRHRVHSDPLVYPGLQDITAYVDFDASADAAEAGGFAITGLVAQHRFLIANGLLDEAQRLSACADVRAQIAVAQQVKTLSLPQEMGQQFKVLAMQKNVAFDMPAMRRSHARG
ncbi:MAG: SAM-dependent methyltransferase [Gammaproteobacteria bacterium]|nr:SAM-dependent methyltransferase [Gammaproteobacteria bacterium]MDH3448008.1 SAM-dependent methyltransferase [Gammaproteobacteria bacterium]